MSTRKPTPTMVDAMRDAATRPYGEFANNGSISTNTMEAIVARGLADWRSIGEVFGRTGHTVDILKRLFLNDTGRAYLATLEQPTAPEED